MLAVKSNPTEVGARAPLQLHPCKNQVAAPRPESHVPAQPGQVITWARKGPPGMEGNRLSKEPAVPKKVMNATWRKVSCVEEAGGCLVNVKDDTNRTKTEDAANRTKIEDAANRTVGDLLAVPEFNTSRSSRGLVVIREDATSRRSSHTWGGFSRGYGGCTPQPCLSNKQPSACPVHAKARRDPAEMPTKVPPCTYKPGIAGWRRSKKPPHPIFFKGATSAIMHGTMETRRKRNHNVAEFMFPDLADLELGDLIEIFRFGYQHWAIYVGDGFVIHLAPPSEFAGAGCASLMSTLTDKALVKKELLSLVVGRNRYRVNNKHDSKYPPLPTTKIVQRAEEMVGRELQYKVTSENCEHFVTELRYGVAQSDQVRDALVGVGIAGLSLAALGVIGAMVKRKKQQNQ